jgi:hypothetical protein
MGSDPTVETKPWYENPTAQLFFKELLLAGYRIDDVYAREDPTVYGVLIKGGHRHHSVGLGLRRGMWRTWQVGEWPQGLDRDFKDFHDLEEALADVEERLREGPRELGR